MRTSQKNIAKDHGTIITDSIINTQTHTVVNNTYVLKFENIVQGAGIRPENFEKVLLEIIDIHNKLLNAKPVSENDPEAAKIDNQIKIALREQQFQTADDRLVQLQEYYGNQRERFEELQDQCALAKAATTARRGDVAIIQVRYQEAAMHFASAANGLSQRHEDRRIEFLLRQADALARQGQEFIDNPALQEAAGIYRLLLTSCPRERVPVEWAAAQSKLGIVLSILGERESGAGTLEEAVAAFKQALMEYTRKKAPLDWAMTKNNLGNALVCLGEREKGTDQLKEAEAAFREALELQDLIRDHRRSDLAGIQANYGNALLRLGEREDGTARLHEAVKFYREAVATYHESFREAFEYARDPAQLENRLIKDRLKLQWATTKNGLGLALRKLDAKEGGTEYLREAERAFRVALRIQKKERVPQQWAKTKNSLGATLRLLGEREHNPSLWDKAEHAYTDALHVYTKTAPLQWAETMNNLGLLYMRRGERESDAKQLKQAVEAFKSALSIFYTDEAEVYKTRYTLHYDTFSANLREASSKLAWTRLSSSEGWLPDIIKGFSPRL